LSCKAGRPQVLSAGSPKPLVLRVIHKDPNLCELNVIKPNTNALRADVDLDLLVDDLTHETAIV